MSSKSRACRLGELASVQGGYAFKSSDFCTEGFAVVKIADIQPPNVSLSNAARVPQQVVAGLDRFRLNDGDILMAMTGATVGKVGRFKGAEPAYLNQRVARITAKAGKAFDDFLYAVISQRGFDSLIEGAAAGSAQANISAAGIASVEVPYLSDGDQLAVGRLARTLDDRIDLLREANATLEAIAQALFKSWFVDFDPVRTKMGGGEPEGMDEAAAALFPAGFEESELGPIPASWSAQPFRSTVHVMGGGTPKTSVNEYWGGSIPWYSVVDAPRPTDVFVIDTEKHITEAGLRGSSTKMLPAGTTIISARGTVGRLALTASPMAMNQSCYGLRGVASDVYFTYFATARLVEQLKQHAHGSVFDTITQETLQSITAVFPGRAIAAAFDSAVGPLMARIEINLRQASTLAELRDSLLPRLITGQLRLEQATELLETA
jgi:restriction endonuclease S subunit